MPGEVHLDIDSSVRPVQMPLRRLPEPIKDELRVELQQMRRDGVIEPVSEPSAWTSALLVVTRPRRPCAIVFRPETAQ